MEVPRLANVLSWVWVIAIGLVVLAVLAGLIALLVRAEGRRVSAQIPLAICLVFLGGCMTMCVTDPCNNYEMYIPAIRDNGGRVVAALERYVAENGSPPDRLDMLVPKYIAEIPATGYPSQQRFKYVHGLGTDFRNRENTEKVAVWFLQVDCSCWWERFGSTYDDVSYNSRYAEWSVPRGRR